MGKISEDHPPQIDGGVFYLERSVNPWDQLKLTVAHDNNLLSWFQKLWYSLRTKRRGWLAVDYYENPVGFFEDGAEVSETMTDFTFEIGYVGKNRKVAVSNANLEYFKERKAHRLAHKQANEEIKPAP